LFAKAFTESASYRRQMLRTFSLTTENGVIELANLCAGLLEAQGSSAPFVLLSMEDCTFGLFSRDDKTAHGGGTLEPTGPVLQGCFVHVPSIPYRL
jgi:hypothetical protein